MVVGVLVVVSRCLVVFLMCWCRLGRGGRRWPMRLSTAIDFSPWADVGFPRVWPSEFPGVGPLFSPGMCGGLVEGLDSFAGGGLGEADRIAGGDDDVGVVHEPVNERGGDGSWHEFLEPGGVQV